MFSDLNVLKTAYAMATHAGHRQAIVARNMANADTPGYRARDIESFETAYSGVAARAGMKATRAGHLNAAQPADRWKGAEITVNSRQDPNGNGVSLEEEMLKAVDAKRQHDKALAIYRSSLNILRISLGKV